MLPRSPKLDDMRTLILDAAERQFSRFSYDKVTMAEIAADAGLKKGSLYHYFAGKEDLMLAVVGRKRKIFHDQVEIILANGDPASDKLRDYVKSRTNYFNDLIELNIIDFYSVARSTPELKRVFGKYSRQEIKWVGKIFEVGRKKGEFQMNSGEAAVVSFMHILQGLRLRFLRSNEGMRPRRVALLQFQREIELITEIFLRGIRRHHLQHPIKGKNGSRRPVSAE